MCVYVFGVCVCVSCSEQLVRPASVQVALWLPRFTRGVRRSNSSSWLAQSAGQGVGECNKPSVKARAPAVVGYSRCLRICFRIMLLIPMRIQLTLTQTPSPAAPSAKNTKTPRHHHQTGGTERMEAPCLWFRFQVHACVHLQLPHINSTCQRTQCSKHTSAIVCPVFSVYPLPPWQERGRSVCSSSCLRCSRPRRCGAASGGSSRLLAHFSSPPKIKSNWLSCGGGGRAIARPWLTRKWHGRWETTRAPVRFRRWKGSWPTGLMRGPSEACKAFKTVPGWCVYFKIRIIREMHLWILSICKARGWNTVSVWTALEG